QDPGPGNAPSTAKEPDTTAEDGLPPLTPPPSRTKPGPGAQPGDPKPGAPDPTGTDPSSTNGLTSFLGKAMLESGSTGKDVSDLQKALAAHGFMVRDDPIFGPETEAAVRAFQSKNGLKVD